MTTAHVLIDDTAEPTALDPTADGAWIKLSAALAEEVPVIADREDLLVTIAPGAGHGAPACFLPTRATIEIDGKHLNGLDPATVFPDSIGDRTRYAAAWGLLTHECAHARHSVWEAPPGTPPDVVAAAELLEESRIEAAQIRRRPDDRHWLRASATQLILADTKVMDPAHQPTMTRRDAAHTAALLLARTDGGILNPDETEPVAQTTEEILGADTLDELRALWQAAHKAADDDTDTMLELGRRWCALVGPEPAKQPDEPNAAGTATGMSTGSSALTNAIFEAVTRTVTATESEPAPDDPTARAATAKTAAEDKAREDAARAAHGVFSDTRTRTRGHYTATAGTRPPNTAERTAARRLGRALSTAGIRDRVTTRTTSAIPPGRLRMRGALAADAQRAAGAIPTAEPFTRTTRRNVPAPPLRIGIACDVSGSMYAFAEPVASAAWILAHAAHHAQVPGTTATVIFGNRVRPITHPGKAPAEVTEFRAVDDYEDVATAIDALDGALDLSRPDAARLLVIVSDGRYIDEPREQAQQRLNRLRAAGCGVLWLAPEGRSKPLDGATVHTLTDPTTTAQAIGHAATAALRATR